MADLYTQLEYVVPNERMYREQRTLTDYYTSNMDLRGGRHNSATNAQSPPCPPSPPPTTKPPTPPGQTTYTDHSILAAALASGLSTVNGAILAHPSRRTLLNPALVTASRRNLSICSETTSDFLDFPSSSPLLFNEQSLSNIIRSNYVRVTAL